MLERLRTLTRSAHERLESELALLSEPLSLSRFQQVLIRFHGFHRAWEPRMAELTGASDFFTPRRRTELLNRDLAALGTQSVRADSPDLNFLSTCGSAWGSAYVVEGSTLGGQIISKALRGAEWAPQGGLQYFNPYGRRTAAMWDQFRRKLAEVSCLEDADEIICGALSTFEALRIWLPAVPEPPE